MAANRPIRNKKYFTVAQANSMLPLVRSIVRDVSELARDLQERFERLANVRRQKGATIGEAYQEEMQEVEAGFERDRERMREYEQELKNLGIELKDVHAGLIDFPCWMDNHEVYLCWRLGEPEVEHWHEVDAGFSGRQRLEKIQAGPNVSNIQTSGL